MPRLRDRRLRTHARSSTRPQATACGRDAEDLHVAVTEPERATCPQCAAARARAAELREAVRA